MSLARHGSFSTSVEVTTTVLSTAVHVPVGTVRHFDVIQYRLVSRTTGTCSSDTDHSESSHSRSHLASRSLASDFKEEILLALPLPSF